MLLAALTAPAQNNILTYQGLVQSGGAPFTGTGQFKFALVTATDSAATATAVANPPSGGFITIINVTFGGMGYVTPPAVTISGGGGSGATATASVSGGVVTGITITAVVPRRCAASATPWAWLPALAQITPRESCACVRFAILL